MPTRRTDNEFVAVVAGLTPWPLSIFDGGGEEVLAHGSWGCSRPDMAQLWRICTVFFWIFPFLLQVGVLCTWERECSLASPDVFFF